MSDKNKSLEHDALVAKDKTISFVLKDFNTWLFSKKYTNVCLTGGTALSKGYKIVRRLSEDIDILIIYDEHFSKTKCKMIKEEIDKYFYDTYSAVPNNPSDINSFKKKGNYSKLIFSFNNHRFNVDVVVRKKIPKADYILQHDIYSFGESKPYCKFPLICITNIFNNKLLAYHNKHDDKSLGNAEMHRVIRHIFDIEAILTQHNDNEILEWLKFYKDYAKHDMIRDKKSHKSHVNLIDNEIFSLDIPKTVKLINNFLSYEIFDVNKKFDNKKLEKLLNKLKTINELLCLNQKK